MLVFFFCLVLTFLNFSIFFFSSRRRHTRWPRDWSSDGALPIYRVSLLIPPGADLTAVLYACFRIGAVTVVADAGLGVDGLTRATIGSHPDWFIGIKRALVGARAMGWLGRRLSGEQLHTVDRTVLGGGAANGQPATPGTQMGQRRAPLDAPWPDPDADAAILFTHGSTGPA